MPDVNNRVRRGGCPLRGDSTCDSHFEHFEDAKQNKHHKKRGSMKRILSLLLILVLAQIVSAQDLSTDSSQPTITVSFNEQILLEGSYAQLTNLQYQTVYPMNIVSKDAFNKVVDFTPKTPVPSGEYEFFFNATDLVYNTISKTININISGAPLSVYYIDPPLGGSTKPKFDVTLGTYSPYNCRYSAIMDVYDRIAPNFDYSPDDAMVTTHVIKNFDIQKIAGTTGAKVELPLYIICKDASGGEASALMYFSYDSTAPAYTITPVPNPVPQPDNLGRMSTTLNVDSDDKVVCRYSLTNSNYTSMTPFDGNDEAKLPSYRMKQSQLVVLPANSSTQKASFSVYVSCKNVAQLITGKTLPINIDQTAPLSITKYSPPDYSPNTSIMLNFSTNKRANCRYVLDGAYQEPKAVNFDVTGGNYHTKDLGSLNITKLTVSVKCTAAQNIATSTFTITIDTTPPDAPTVNVPATICAKEITANFSGYDNESNVSSYNYSVSTTKESIVNWTVTSTPNIKVTIPKSINVTGATFVVAAYSINRAGLQSTTAGASAGTTYDTTGFSCDKTPPTVKIKTNDTSDGTIVTLICSDDVSQCDNATFSFAWSGNKSCEDAVFGPLDYDPELKGYSVKTPSSRYFCYEVSDKAGNERNGSEKIEVKLASSSHCINNQKDSDETGVDCGGKTCIACSVGSGCVANSDCTSSYCVSELCKEALCDDKVQNGGESAVDCGGICDPCAIGVACKMDTDCVTSYCSANNTCAEASCTDGVRNGKETDSDCGGDCNKCAKGSSCKLSADCVTGNCAGGVCAEDDKKDSDGDGMPDIWELQNGLDPTNPADANEKYDSTSWSNFEQYQYSVGLWTPPEGFQISTLFAPKYLLLILGFMLALIGAGYSSITDIKLKKQKGTSAEQIKITEPMKQAAIKAALKGLTPDEIMRRMAAKEKEDKSRSKMFESFGEKKEAVKPSETKELKPSIISEALNKPAKPKEEDFEKLGKIGKKSEFERLEAMKGEGVLDKLSRLVKPKEENEFEKLGKLKGGEEGIEKFGKYEKKSKSSVEDIKKLSKKRKK